MLDRKNSRFYKGTLENAGLGEVAFFLKKAAQQAQYAAFALENTDFEEPKRRISGVAARVASIMNAINELEQELYLTENEVAEAIVSEEDKEKEEV